MNPVRLAGVLAALVAVPVSASAQDSWTTRAPLPVARYFHASASVGSRVFVFGGQSTGVLSSLVPPEPHVILEYVPATDSWISRTAIGTVDYWAGVCGVAFGGDLYQFARTGTFPYVGQTWRYSVASDAWTRLADMPEPGSFCRASASATAIWVTGGAGSGSSVRAFDPVAGSWSSGPDYPDSIFGHVQGIVGNRLLIAHAFGLRELDLDDSSPAWTGGISVPAYFPLGVGAIAYGKFLLAYGNGSASSISVLEYDPPSGSFATRAPIPGGSFGAAACSVVGPDGTAIFVSRGTGMLRYDPVRPPAPTIAGLEMSVPGGPVLQEGATVNAPNLRLAGTVGDPSSFPVRLELEVVPADAPFTGVPTASTAYGPGGLLSLDVVLPSEGWWKWRARAADDQGLASEWIEFGTTVPDVEWAIPSPPPAPEPFTGVSGPARTGCSAGAAGSSRTVLGAAVGLILAGLAPRLRRESAR